MLDVGTNVTVIITRLVSMLIHSSQGKGFAGVMKRHNFGGLEATHGVSISHRSHGSTGHVKIRVRYLRVRKWLVT